MMLMGGWPVPSVKGMGWPWLSMAARLRTKVLLPSPASPLHHRDLAEGDVGIPQPFDLPYLDLAGLCDFDFCHVTAPSIGLIMA